MQRLLGIRVVFGDVRYILLASIIGIVVSLVLLILDGLLFITPSFVFYLPDEKVVDFSLLMFIPPLSGVVSSMSFYVYQNFRYGKLGKVDGPLGLFGPIFGVATGVCGCSSVGCAIITTLGAVGSTGMAFISNFQIPLRVVSISFLLLSLFYTNRSIIQQCNVPESSKDRRVEYQSTMTSKIPV